MKILRIRFQNLNSLPEADLDLSSGPLARSGIFAITGSTGSGKSTILDAITLALYGRAARYDQTPNPESMMSRHTGACHAEVTFEAKGALYRAEWQLRRAREKADGKLQAATRRLYDADGNILAQSIKETDRLIEEITGLDYHRFLRSVLLAQGQFAQFLKASESERADLLESLTGTTIYSELSTLAYREAAERELELKSEATAMESVTLLSPEEQASRQEAIAESEKQSATLTLQRETLAARLASGEQLAALLTRRQTLQQEATAITRQREEAQPDLARLARWRTAQPYLPALGRLEERRLEAARLEKVAQETQRMAAQAEHQLASTHLSAHRFAQSLLARSRQQLEADRTKERQTVALHTERSEWLAARQGEAELEKQLASLAARLTSLANHRREVAAASTVLKELQSEQQRARQTLEGLEREHAAAIKAADHARKEWEAAQNVVNTLLSGRPAETVLTTLDALKSKHLALVELRGALEIREKATAEALQLSSTEAGLSDEIEAARAHKTVTESEARDQAHLLELAERHLAHLEKVAGMSEQRAALVPGEACPLCGSQEHPLASPHQPVSLQMESARRNLQAARLGNANAAKEAELATMHLVRTEEALKQVHLRRAQLRQEQMTGYDTFENLARQQRIYTQESLTTALEANRQKRERLEKLHRSVREAEQKAAANEVATAKAHGTLAELTGKREATKADLTRLDTAISRQQETLQRLEHEATLDPLTAALAPFGLTLPEPGQEAAMTAQLEARLQQWRQRQQELITLEKELREQQFTLSRKEETLEALCRQATTLAISDDGAPLPPAPWQQLAEAEGALEAARRDAREAAILRGERGEAALTAKKGVDEAHAALLKELGASPFATVEALSEAQLSPQESATLEALERNLEHRARDHAARLAGLEEQITPLRAAGLPEGEALAVLRQEHRTLEEQLLAVARERTTLQNELAHDQRLRSALEARRREHAARLEQLTTWLRLRDLIGSADGRRFSRYAQGLSLDLLVRHANRHLQRLNERYQLRRSGELALEIVDRFQADVTRPMASLSGGESFLVSLALALGLSDLAGRNVRIDSLFIDEGFGSLDADTLDAAVAALDTLRLHQKTVGIISHVELLKERIPTQVRVEKLAGGVSRISVTGS